MKNNEKIIDFLQQAINLQERHLGNHNPRAYHY